jgi:hypothetical protein
LKLGPAVGRQFFKIGISDKEIFGDFRLFCNCLLWETKVLGLLFHRKSYFAEIGGATFGAIFSKNNLVY